jgi:broad specificity phosphatase PhoE
MEILFIRHGQSTQNVALENDEAYDRNNIVLTKLGEKQATYTGKYIPKIFGKIDAIYHSPIYRCQQTAELIAKNMNFTKDLISDELLLEANENSKIDNYDDSERKKWYDKVGKKFNEISQHKNPFERLEISKKYTRKTLNDIDSYPNFDDIFNNYNKFLNKIKKSGHKRIIVVGHGGTTGHMIKIITGIDIYNEDFFTDQNIKVKNCSICCVLYKDKKFQLVTLPNDKHLEKIK